MRRTLRLSIALLMVFLPFAAQAATPPDRLVKASGRAVYYFASNGKRYVFPNEGTYFSWFSDFSGIIQLSDAELASMPLGGNVTYRPGIQMLKVQTDPRVYAVAPGGTLRWVLSERVAEDLYGQYWNKVIADVSDAFFVNYKIGDPIQNVNDFSPLEIAEQVDTINDDKGIPVSATPRRSDTEPNIVDAWRSFALAHLNELRQKNGKGPLVMNRLLNYIATIHSKDMAINIGSLSHTGSLGETFMERIRFGKVPDVKSKTLISVPHPENVGYWAENVGLRIDYSKKNVVEESIVILHDAYMAEPPSEVNHRSNMLGTYAPFTEVGIGVYLDAQNAFWLTEDFVSLQ